MRLRSLLHCIQCHLVLLILVGLAVAGYLLRDELGILIGWPGTGPQSATAIAPVGQGGTEQGATPLPPAVGVPGRGLGSEDAPEPSMVEGSTTYDRGGVGQGGLDVSPWLTQGEFHFRPMDDSISPDSSDVDAERKREMLAVARRAYWNHDIPLAIRHYQALTRAYPNDPDFYGEMGNIYYEQGEHELAGQAYSQAGLLLLRRGQRARARELADLVQKIAPSYAQDLLERLQGAR